MTDDENPGLTPANENPWYWLATLYGEQEEGTWRTKFGHELTTKNRLAWNRCMAAALSVEEHAKLIGKGVDATELAPFSDKEREEFVRLFAKRAGRKEAALPTLISCADFSRLNFERPASFRGFCFPNGADFSEAAFSGMWYWDFREAAFCRDSSFDEAAFSGHADFGWVSFSIVGFSKAKFCREASFYKGAFSRGAFFNGAAFSSTADFSKAAFSGHADFLASKFKGRVNFAGAKFKTHAPDFRDAKLPEATEWHGAEWPSPPQDKDDAQQQVYAYERLKAEMDRLKKHADEQFFFAKELRARRALESRGSLQWLLNYAYDLSCGYGQSVEWPFLWLVVLFALGADFFALAPVHDGAPLAYDVAAGLSATNLFSLLPYKPKLDDLSTSAKIIGDVQSALGLILLFLLGLALRNRFRMK